MTPRVMLRRAWSKRPGHGKVDKPAAATVRSTDA